MGKLGCLLILLSMAGLCVIIVLPVLPFMESSQTIDDLLQPLVCEPGEKIERDQYQTAGSRGGTLFTMSVYCIGSEGSRRSATDRWTLIGAGIFAIPFLVGLFSVIFGATRSAQKAAAGAPVMTLSGQAAALSPAGSGAGSTLAQKLKELDEARDAGLITADEYERLRQEILDSSF
jgi:hypothetical protein